MSIKPTYESAKAFIIKAGFEKANMSPGVIAELISKWDGKGTKPETIYKRMLANGINEGCELNLESAPNMMVRFSDRSKKKSMGMGM